VEDPAPIQGAREQIPDCGLNVEPARGTEKVVVSEASFHLEEIHGVESSANASLARRCFLDCDDDDLGRVGGCNVYRRSGIDGRASKQIRLVEGALAAQHLGPNEDIAHLEGQGFPDRSLVHVVIAVDDDVLDCRFVFRIECERDDGCSRCGVDYYGGIDYRVGVALVVQPCLQKHPRSVEPDEIERATLTDHDARVDLSPREQRRRLIDDDVRYQSGRPFLDEESDAHLVVTARNDGCIDFGLAVAALPVENADAQNVALQLHVVEILFGVEILRFADPTERDQDEAVAV